MLEKIRWYWRYYRRYKLVVAALLLLTPLQAMFQVSIPKLFQYAIDFVKEGTPPSSQFVRWWLARLEEHFSLSTPAAFMVLLIAIGFVAASLYATVQSIRAWMNLRFEWLFRQDAFERIMSKGPDFYRTFRTGDLVTRLTDDVAEKLSWFACSGIFRFYEALITVAFTVVMMISIDPRLTLMTAGPLPLLIVVFFKSSTTLDKRYDFLQRRISAFNDVMEACFSGIRVVKAYVKEQAQKRKFQKALDERRQAEIDAIKAGLIVDSFYRYIWQIGVVIVLLAGGYMVIRADLSLGKLLAFIFYVANLVFPMFDIGSFLVKSRQSAVSIDRLQELERFAPMVVDSGRLTGNGSFEGEIRYEDVCFVFPGSEQMVIDHVSLTVEAGRKVALVGKVGAGKTWLVNMLPRFVDPTDGRVSIDGHDVREYRLDALRRHIGFVPQEPVLFSDTVRNNILLGREIDEETLWWAIEIAQLKEEVSAFPNGIDTPIGTKGMAISGGQKQRLSLARALVGKPKILVLDDCTSALDSHTEAALWQSLSEVMPGLTAILITHRPDTLERVDTIFVLEQGKVVEHGTHADLMRRGNSYARIYKRYRLERAVT